ncbi:unnamed protein product [Acanthocheilonema viteae]|uniref:Uncharacterized protein n=1 Tax=Acanthocheilonema viteae TaxID=6277 RepID=A0A498S5N8_ACAVI|nr:unnamed protein product [Acanthocheilonema viteae]
MPSEICAGGIGEESIIEHLLGGIGCWYVLLWRGKGRCCFLGAVAEERGRERGRERERERERGKSVCWRRGKVLVEGGGRCRNEGKVEGEEEEGRWSEMKAKCFTELNECERSHGAEVIFRFITLFLKELR